MRNLLRVSLLKDSFISARRVAATSLESRCPDLDTILLDKAASMTHEAEAHVAMPPSWIQLTKHELDVEVSSGLYDI